MAHIFTIEQAKSNRAGCKACKEKIEKEKVRIGYSQDPEKMGVTDDKMKHMMLAPKWYHFACFEKFKSPKWFKENLCAPEQVKGFEAMPAQEQFNLTELWKMLFSGKRMADSSCDSLREASKNQGVLSDADFESIEASKEELNKKSIEQLKAMLAKNNLAKTGTKAELVERVAENKVLGSLTVCPTCSVGKLKWNRSDGSVTCPGFFDDIAGMYKRCKGPSKDTPVKRIPWEDF